MSSAHFICTTCGTQYAESGTPPAYCATCDDERQYVPPSGQQWTDLLRLSKTYRNSFQKEEGALYSIDTIPQFGVGQRALLLRTPAGNVLWDCITLLDETTVDLLNGLGGLSAIAISHPHYSKSTSSVVV